MLVVGASPICKVVRCARHTIFEPIHHGLNDCQLLACGDKITKRPSVTDGTRQSQCFFY